MAYLLDTRTCLWLRHSPSRLPEKALELLSDVTPQGLISVVTPCEIAIKTGAGKLNGASLFKDFERRETAVGFSIAAITATHLTVCSSLNPSTLTSPSWETRVSSTSTACSESGTKRQ